MTEVSVGFCKVQCSSAWRGNDGLGLWGHVGVVGMLVLGSAVVAHDSVVEHLLVSGG